MGRSTVYRTGSWIPHPGFFSAVFIREISRMVRAILQTSLFVFHIAAHAPATLSIKNGDVSGEINYLGRDRTIA